jgi:ribosomal-protein-alanine N-acetyltransferase
MRYPDIPAFSVRSIDPADAAAWAAYICLPDVRRHTSSTAETVADVLHDIEKALADERRTSLRFVIETLGDRQLVGTVGFHTISELHRTAEIAYDIAPSHRGQGIATAACRAATRWGFEVCGWNRVQGTTVLANLASQRVLERCGYQREGLLRNFRMVQGRSRDYWLYSTIPGDFGSAGLRV